MEKQQCTTTASYIVLITTVSFIREQLKEIDSLVKRTNYIFPHLIWGASSSTTSYFRVCSTEQDHAAFFTSEIHLFKIIKIIYLILCLNLHLFMSYFSK